MNEELVAQLREMRERISTNVAESKAMFGDIPNDHADEERDIAALDAAITALSSPPTKGEAAAWGIISGDGRLIDHYNVNRKYSIGDAKSNAERYAAQLNADDYERLPKPFTVRPLVFADSTPSVPLPTREEIARALLVLWSGGSSLLADGAMSDWGGVRRMVALQSADAVLALFQSPERDDATAPEERT